VEYFRTRNWSDQKYISNITFRQERLMQGFGGETFHLEDPGVDGRIILRRIFRKWDVVGWIGLIWLRIGTGGGNL
jgi:hypothetical protein